MFAITALGGGSLIPLTLRNLALAVRRSLLNLLLATACLSLR